MKALQTALLIVLAIFISAVLAAADADELAAMVTIRSHVPGLDSSWSDTNIMQVCHSYVQYITCTDGHVTGINFDILFTSSPSIGTLGNISGLRYLKSLSLGPRMQVPDLDAWHNQLPNLTSLSFSTNPLGAITPIFTGDFSQNPLLTAFKYIDTNTSVFPSSIVGAPGLKSLTISVPKVGNLRSDFLAGMNLTSLSFSTTGSSLAPPTREFPDFSHLAYLETLDLSYTSILELQDNFTNLRNLRTLYLEGCQFLTKIASSVSDCVKLEYIGCDGCKLNRADSIPNLSSTRLNQLYLASNDISTWPTGLCQLSTNPSSPGLTLGLSYNNISDPPACFASTVLLYSITFIESALTSIPTYFGNFARLTSLTVQSNSQQMTGGLPGLLGTKMSYLTIQNCGLHGNLPDVLPPTLHNLRINGNRLTGTIPDNIFADLPYLSEMDISDNDFVGAFPSSINMTRVHTLFASNNSFTSIPDSIVQLYLFKVDFRDNNLNSIPSDDAWEKVSGTMSYFSLANNRQLDGTLPAFWSKLESRLNDVDLSGCSFTGDVPSINSYSLSKVILSDNALDGIIQPSGFGPMLLTFKVDHNALSGSIPPSFGDPYTGFVSIQVFDVSFNQLIGPIPSSFQNIFDQNTLQEFYFNNNDINGSLPNLTKCTGLNIFEGDHTKVSLCDSNPQPRPHLQCVLNDVEFPGSCGCESWYTTCATNTCTNPDFVSPLDPPGAGAPTHVLPPGTPLGDLVSVSPLPSPTDPPRAEVPVGSATSSVVHVCFLLILSLLGALIL